MLACKQIRSDSNNRVELECLSCHVVVVSALICIPRAIVGGIAAPHRRAARRTTKAGETAVMVAVYICYRINNILSVQYPHHSHPRLFFHDTVAAFCVGEQKRRSQLARINAFEPAANVAIREGQRT